MDVHSGGFSFKCLCMFIYIYIITGITSYFLYSWQFIILIVSRISQWHRALQEVTRVQILIFSWTWVWFVTLAVQYSTLGRIYYRCTSCASWSGSNAPNSVWEVLDSDIGLDTGFSKSPQANSGIIPRSGHDHFLRNPLQFFMHRAS
jgi:hypothetical protein